jgi:glycosidase
MPIMPSPTYHKYDVTDYTAIDPAYGTLEDFQALLDACHARGIRLIIDFVFNHTSAKHLWFLQAVEYYKTLAPSAQPDYSVCPYAAYYHFSTDKKGASGWYRVGNTEWYYEGMFWDQMPDLALENEQFAVSWKTPLPSGSTWAWTGSGWTRSRNTSPAVPKATMKSSPGFPIT